MFRPVAVLMSVAIPLAFAPAARAADDPKEVIAQAIKAHGGEEFLTKNNAAQSKAKGKLDLPGVGEVEFTQETAYMIPDKFKEAMELKIAGQTVSTLTLVSGDTVTIDVNGNAINVPDGAKDAFKELRYMLRVGRMVPLLKEKGFELSIIGDDKVEGKEVVGVRVSAKDQKDISLYFDKKTHLLAKLERRTADPTTGVEFNEERIVMEYQKLKAGVPMVKKLVVKRDGKMFLEAEVVAVEFLEKIDDSEFKK